MRVSASPLVATLMRLYKQISRSPLAAANIGFYFDIEVTHARGYTKVLALILIV